MIALSFLRDYFLQQMLKRIQAVSSSYSNLHWKEQWETQMNYRKSLSKFPKFSRRCLGGNKTRKLKNSKSSRIGKVTKSSSVSRKVKRTLRPQRTTSNKGTSRNWPRDPGQSAVLEGPKRNSVLVRKAMTFSGELFVVRVEAAKTGDDFVINIYHPESAEEVILVIKPPFSLPAEERILKKSPVPYLRRAAIVAEKIIGYLRIAFDPETKQIQANVIVS